MNQTYQLDSEELDLINEMILEKRTYANFAIFLKNRISMDQDYIISEPSTYESYASNDFIRIEEEMNLLNVYPNPATDLITVEIVTDQENGSIDILNSAGQLINSYNVSLVAGKVQLNVSDLAPGIYFVVMTDQEKGFTEKAKLIKY